VSPFLQLKYVIPSTTHSGFSK